MDEINCDPSSDFLENEKFDFDLAFSPNIKQDLLNKPEEADDEEEVFFGPVGFTEQCVATRAKTLQEENNIKPLSPLTGEQVVEIFKEATKVVLRLEKLSSTQSPISSSSSSKGSLSSSILKLSSTSSESPSWLTGKLSSGSSDGAIRFESDKENIQPLSRKVENFSINESQQPVTHDENVHISLAYKSDKIAPAIANNEKTISNVDGRIEHNGHFDEESISLDKNGKNSLAVLGECKMSDNIKTKTAQNGDENVHVLSNEEHLNVNKNEGNIPIRLDNIESCAQENEQVNSKKVLSTEVVDEKVDGTKEINKTNIKIPAVKARGSGLLKPGFRNSRLPKSKNIQKSQSAFSSPIRTTGSSNKREAAMKSDNAVEKSETSKSSSSKLQKSVPAKLPQDASKVTSRSSKTLAKRKIFNSSEALDKLGEKECKPKTKLPVNEQSKIPGFRPRRRRSSSLSSLDSSQSSASSQTSQDDNPTSKLTRPSTKIPTTKTTIASSFGLVRRSKLQETTAEKKVQPLKALPRPGFTSSAKNSKADTKAAKAMPPPQEQETRNDKIPMAATPKSSSSLPVARRRSSFKSSLSSTSSREGSPPKYFTPSRQAGRIAEPRATSSTCKRKSSKPTPTRNAPSSASRRSLRSSGDDNMFSLSPPSKPQLTRKTNRKLIPDNDPSPAVVTCLPTQTVDDLLDCDNNDPILGDVVPIQPKPIPQADLIDLSDL